MYKHYFVNDKEVDRKEFERLWNEEGFEDTNWDGKLVPYPPPSSGLWEGKNRYSVRSEK